MLKTIYGQVIIKCCTFLCNHRLGPWTTAALILKKREEVRKAREEKLKDLEDGILTEDTDSIYYQDQYDEVLSTISKRHLANHQNQVNVTNFLQPSSLYDICCQKVADKINYFDFDTLQYVPSEQRGKIAQYLAKNRRLTLTEALLLFCREDHQLILPDCSLLDEDSLLKIIENIIFCISAESSEDYSLQFRSNFQQLVLKNCGRGFSDRVAAVLCNAIHKLEVLYLDGCYRMSDDALVKLLDECKSSLHSLSLRCNSRLSLSGMKKISTMSALRVLRLDFTEQLTDDHLQVFFKSLIAPLEEISLRGLTRLSPDALKDFVEFYGKRLKSLDFSGCQVNDTVVSSIRNHCLVLSELFLEQIDEVSTTAFLGLFIPDQSQNQNKGRTLGPLSSVSFQGCSSVSDEDPIDLEIYEIPIPFHPKRSLSNLAQKIEMEIAQEMELAQVPPIDNNEIDEGKNQKC